MGHDDTRPDGAGKKNSDGGAVPGFGTMVVHAGSGLDERTGAVVPAIQLSSTFGQDGVGGLRSGFEYSRTSNPTRREYEAVVGELEGGTAAAFASGLAAIDVIAKLVPDGGRVVCSDDAYGGTLRLLARLHSPRLMLDVVDLTDPSLYAGAFDGAAMVIAETPTNPLLRVIDIAVLADAVHRAGALLVVDSTFATPYNTTPLALGADVVVHSATKYLSGHSDVVGGVIVVTDAAIDERIRWIQNAAGAVPSPFDCYLLIRGIKTLALRMERHAENASLIAEYLEQRGLDVHYPGLASHPQHTIASAQMRTPGGMVSVDIGDGPTAEKVAGATQLFTLAESLGAVESLIEVPAAMTHASLVALEDDGISVLVPPPGLLRLSVGVEDVGDLVADLDRAFAAAGV